MSNNIQAQQESFEISYPYKLSSTIVSLDNQGYLWFPNNTQTDYYRYNGQGIDELGLPALLNDPSNKYFTEHAIFLDSKLLLKNGHQLSLFDIPSKSLVSNWELPVDHLIKHVHIDDEGSIWVFTSHQKNKTRPVFKSTNGKDYQLVFDLSLHLGDKPVIWWSGISDAEGLFYFHGKYGGLLILNAEGVKQELYLDDPQAFDEKMDCSVFRVDNRNNLWRMHQQDFAIYNKQLGQFISQPISNKVHAHSDCPAYFHQGFEINFIWTDYKGRQWLGGGDSNLYLYDHTKGELIFFGKTIVDNIGGKGGDVHSFIGDGQGNFYGAKRGGVFKLSEKQDYFQTYVENTKDEKHPIYKPLPKQVMDYIGEEHLTNSIISSICQDQNEDLFFMDYRFVFKLNSASDEVAILPLFHPLSKIDLNFTKKHKVLSMWSTVLNFDDQFNPTPSAYSPSKLEKVFEQKNGAIWYTGFQKVDYKTGQFTGLFAQVDSETLAFSGNYIDPAGKVNFDDTYINSIVEDKDGNLWLGSHQGILNVRTAGDGSVEIIGNNFLYKEKDITFSPKNKLYLQVLENDQIGIHADHELGILNTKTKKLTKFISGDKLGIKQIYASYFVDEDVVWFCTLSGLHYFEFSTQKLIRFSTNEGFKAKKPTIIKKLKNDKFTIGTDNGLYIFHPDSLLSHYTQDELRYKNVKLNVNSYSYLNGDSDTIHKHQYFNATSDPLKLTYQDRMLSFDFALMDFNSPNQHQFSYWLEGYDKNWSTPSADNHIKFTYLPAGRYQLKVKANNGNGIWSDDILSIPIRIKPAWYKTWWFLIGSLLTFLALAYFLFRHYLSLEKKQLDLKLQQKEAARIKEMDETKNLFFTNITHEFKTPLTVIMGVNDYSDAPEEEKSLIRTNSNHLLHLINQLLDISKLESQKIKLNFSQGDIIPYLKYLTSSFYSMAADKNIQLDFQTDLDTLVMNYDETRIQQIIYNLLSNALKFTAAGGSVTMTVKEINQPDLPQINISIKDTGCGIPKNELPYIFDHFHQVSNAITKVGEGTGVGLSLTRGLLNLMKGEIQVRSELDQGTEFIVLLPIQKQWSEDLTPSTFDSDEYKLGPISSLTMSPTKITDLSQADGNSYTENDKPILLLIEDNPDVVTYICNLLEESYQIVISLNGGQGIEKAIEIIPDIIISDVMMPIKNGYEVCETLKQDQKTNHIPIILLTAKSSLEDKLVGLKFGADAYLKKPFHKDELLIRLEQLLLVRKKIQERYVNELRQASPAEILPQDEFAHKLKQTIEANLADANFGVPELALALLMSQSQVFRKTKAVLGMPPMLLIRSFRLTKAQELLKNQTLTIAEVAAQTGFANPNYFSRAFQKEFGTSPSKYRKSFTT